MNNFCVSHKKLLFDSYNFPIDLGEKMWYTVSEEKEVRANEQQRHTDFSKEDVTDPLFVFKSVVEV